MRTFWILALVLVAVLALATAASASVRDGVSSLVGTASGASADSGGGTFTVKALKSGGEPDASGTGTAWVVKNAAENAGEADTYTFRTTQDPAGTGDCDTDRTGTEVEPAGPEAQVQPDEPVAEETATTKAKKAEKSDDAE